MTYGQQPGFGPSPGGPGQGPPGGAGGHGQQPPYAGPGYGQAPYGPPQRYDAPPYAGPQQYFQPQQPPIYAEPPRKARRRRVRVPTGGPVTDEDERWAVPAYVGMFVTGFVAPVVVLAARGRSSHFVRFHAAQALNLSIAMTVCNTVTFLLAYLNGVSWLPLPLAVLVAEYCLIVKAAIRANRYEWYRLPSLVAWPIFG